MLLFHEDRLLPLCVDFFNVLWPNLPKHVEESVTILFSDRRKDIGTDLSQGFVL
jgi:hypothetical protein